jgi:hypothetical protein
MFGAEAVIPQLRDLYNDTTEFLRQPVAPVSYGFALIRISLILPVEFRLN